MVDDEVPTDAVEVVLAAAELFAAVTAESVAHAGAGVTLPQLRVLTVAAEEGPLRNVDVAQALDIHISNASRLCDRLVRAGLLDRRDSPADRRQVELRLTRQGRELVDAVIEHRREVFARVLDRMPRTQQRAFTTGLAGFVRAGEGQLGYGGGER